MSAPLKDGFGPEVVAGLARDLVAAWPAFDAAGFVADATDGLGALELLDRGRHVAAALARYLPSHFPDAAAILTRSFGPELVPDEPAGLAPFRYMPYGQFVMTHGLPWFDEAMAFNHALTRRFTAEFSVRPFLEHHYDRTMARLHDWATDPNVHVRRLVSEGTRPRLPWAPRIARLVRDPAPGLALLERLRDDPERYVQRSVANHLGDVAKDHPDVAVGVAARWWADGGPSRRWIVRHGLRHLVKQGHPGALAILGHDEPPAVRIVAARVPARVVIGERLAFEVELESTGDAPQRLLVDYAVHFAKARGTSAKVFKLRTVDLAPGARVTLRGAVSFAVHSTRRPRPGPHRVELRVNGVALPLAAFDVLGG